jgi:hypothetical protein
MGGFGTGLWWLCPFFCGFLEQLLVSSSGRGWIGYGDAIIIKSPTRSNSFFLFFIFWAGFQGFKIFFRWLQEKNSLFINPIRFLYLYSPMDYTPVIYCGLVVHQKGFVRLYHHQYPITIP